MTTNAAVRQGNKAMKQFMSIVDRPSGNTPSRSALPERSERDFQRAKVYAADQQMRRMLDRQHEFPLVTVAGSRITVPLERKFGTLEQIQEYVDTLTARSWPGYEWAQGEHVQVVKRHGTEAAHYNVGKIHVADFTDNKRLTRWALRQFVICHEFAHHLATQKAKHGPEFVQAFRMLVTDQMGPEAGLMFNVLMNEAGAQG